MFEYLTQIGLFQYLSTGAVIGSLIFILGFLPAFFKAEREGTLANGHDYVSLTIIFILWLGISSLIFPYVLLKYLKSPKRLRQRVYEAFTGVL